MGGVVGELALIVGGGYLLVSLFGKPKQPPADTAGVTTAGQTPEADSGSTDPSNAIDIPLGDVGAGGAGAALGGLLWGAAAVAVLTEFNLQKKKRAQFSALWALYATAEQDIWTHKKLRAIDSWNIRDHERVRNYENRLVMRYKDWTEEQMLERFELNLAGHRFFPDFTLNHVAGWTEERTLY